MIKKLMPRRVRVSRSVPGGVGQLAGAAAVGYGLWSIYEPLAFIVVGAMVVLVSYGLGADE